jgi:hypothetical protein
LPKWQGKVNDMDKWISEGDMVYGGDLDAVCRCYDSAAHLISGADRAAQIVELHSRAEVAEKLLGEMAWLWSQLDDGDQDAYHLLDTLMENAAKFKPQD